jgi:hypothetical protein
MPEVRKVLGFQSLFPELGETPPPTRLEESVDPFLGSYSDSWQEIPGLPLSFYLEIP